MAVTYHTEITYHDGAQISYIGNGGGASGVWTPAPVNDLPFELRSVLMAHPSKFYISLKSFFFVRGWAGSTSE